MTTLFSVIFLISSIVLIVSVMLMEEKTQGLGVLSGGNDSFFGNGKSRSKEFILNRITTIAAVLFMISALVLAAI